MHRNQTARPAGRRLSLLASALALTGVLVSAGGALSSDPRHEPLEPSTNAASTNAAAADGRVIVLGFDGADARTVRELMAADPGRYPTFEKLASTGTFEPLEVVAPPESPVSWAALNTGQNPAKTGVPGFIKRNLNPAVNAIPGFGHIEKKTVSVDKLDNLPIPNWSATTLGGVLGGTGLLAGLVLGLLLFRRFVVGILLGLLLGLPAGYVGYSARGYLPDEYPITANPNKAKNFWDVTASNGVPTVVLDAAQSFNMPVEEGAKVLSGLGVPDARGALGEWFIYTTDPDPERSSYEGEGTTTAGTVYRVDERGGQIFTKVWGPKNFWEIQKLKKELDEIGEQLSQPSLSMEKTLELSKRKGELEPLVGRRGAYNSDAKNDGRVALDLEIAIQSDAADVTIGGQKQTIAVGEWSDWYELDFELNPLISVKAVTRARLVSIEPHFELYVNVLDVDPRDPPFWQPLSAPHEFSSELAMDCGLYETYGWPTMTMPFKDREIDAVLLMEDVEFTMKWREDLTHSVLDKNDWRVFMSVFSTTDRVQHMMYQFYDPEHPLYDEERASRKMTFFGEEIAFKDAIPEIYRHMDRIIGDVLERLEPDDTLIVCSDHGFQSFRRQVNVNNWLYEEGFLGWNEKTSDTGYLKFVDWEETQVYSLGMGFLYLNLEGREPKGIVDPSEAEELMAEVRRKLLAATDDDGTPICKDVYVTKDIHSGPYLDMESDMLIGFAPTYRVSWSSTGGDLGFVKDENGNKVLAPVVVDNTSPWSGGHISVHLPDVAGVFFCNKQVKVPEEGVRALNIAPTILDLVGLAVPEEMDLGPLDL